MQFGRRSALLKEYGEQAVTAVMEQVGQMSSGRISGPTIWRSATRRQRSRWCSATRAKKKRCWRSGETATALAAVRFPGKDQGVEFSAGLAQAVMQQHFDPVDIVTEVANRADHALEAGNVAGRGQHCESGAAVRGFGGGGVRKICGLADFVIRDALATTVEPGERYLKKLRITNPLLLLNSQVGRWPAHSSIEVGNHVETWRHCHCQWGAHALGDVIAGRSKTTRRRNWAR
jgi:hypothetical protein